jgi:hypothetical protein
MRLATCENLASLFKSCADAGGQAVTFQPKRRFRCQHGQVLLLPNLSLSESSYEVHLRSPPDNLVDQGMYSCHWRAFALRLSSCNIMAIGRIKGRLTNALYLINSPSHRLR